MYNNKLKFIVLSEVNQMFSSGEIEIFSQGMIVEPPTLIPSVLSRDKLQYAVFCKYFQNFVRQLQFLNRKIVPMVYNVYFVTNSL